MTPNNATPLLDAAVRADKLPASGRELLVHATPGQLLAIARIARVSTIHRLAARVQLVPVKGGIELIGTLEAEVVQPCVVTLDPVVQKIEELLSRVFSTAPDIHNEAGAGSERFIDLESDDLPDHFQGNELDLCDYLLEVLGLAIDLYPKAPGARMSDEQKGDDPAELSAFSALKSLKQDMEKGE